MRIAHIAFMYGGKNAGGACIAATRLHKALLSHGVDSHYLCWEASEAGENVCVLPQGLKRKVYYYLTRLSHYGMGYSPVRRPVPLNWVPLFGLEDALGRIQPDVVHVQWINEDVVSFEQLARLRYPTVMSMHDLFMLNAIDPYAGRDRRFVEGYAKENSNFLERWLFARKHKAVAALQPLFIGPSKWICDECRQSIVGRGLTAVCVPNIIDSAFFEKGGRASRSKNTFTILFGANGGRRNPLKGFAELEKALSFLPEDVRRKSELLILGENGEDVLTAGMRTRFLGEFTGSYELAKVYACAELSVVPSKEDNAPQTKFEALARGLPVVVFQRTGCAEGISHLVNGWIAADGDIAGYAKGIEHFFRRWERGEFNGLHEQIAEETQARYGEVELVRRMMQVYESCRREHGAKGDV